MMRAAMSLVQLALVVGRAATANDIPTTATVAVSWEGLAPTSCSAIPTYLDQVNPSMDRVSPMHDAAFGRMDKLGAKLVRYLHWSASQAPFAELSEGEFNFTKM